MTLTRRTPSVLAPDPSRKQTIEFTSPADGCPMKVDVYSPSHAGADGLPLLLAPHAITWTAAEDYHGGLQGLMRKYHPGYYGLAEKHGVIIAMPHGHHHRRPCAPWAGPNRSMTCPT